ncbi:hypothetical protein GCM10008171_17530 [Methylopila jiangsuensis]|uniref:Uracil-DNA glycosylase-like domain-containing protein n=1 Tax=Methylopila jiangsuensis TaxID=586230 RepID=A0A9W6JI56_9HYPH|nr:uracil-DNA glycosylase family protein [Methylopila jiangsuensis]MDR6287013.1 uracil-DNA glycosylase [Methylopila jiangsuensis]GLK76499.1 hypothetical protein GCM10008171_17530 [Methylopila jiangsuensis]
MTSGLLDNAVAIAERADALGLPHVAPLEAYAELLRQRHGDVPHFDPFDGGVGARLLVLLATPGPSTALIRFTSRDNPTGTARTLRRLFDASEIDRRETVLWNAVPWILPRRGAQLGVPRKRDIEDARNELPRLLSLLPRLEVVLLLGGIASEVALARIQQIGLTALVAPHPSPTNLAADRTAAGALARGFDSAASKLCVQS